MRRTLLNVLFFCLKVTLGLHGFNRLHSLIAIVSHFIVGIIESHGEIHVVAFDFLQLSRGLDIYCVHLVKLIHDLPSFSSFLVSHLLHPQELLCHSFFFLLHLRLQIAEPELNLLNSILAHSDFQVLLKNLILRLQQVPMFVLFQIVRNSLVILDRHRVHVQVYSLQFGLILGRL